MIRVEETIPEKLFPMLTILQGTLLIFNLDHHVAATPSFVLLFSFTVPHSCLIDCGRFLLAIVSLARDQCYTAA
ncbi:hypothetical protein BKA66DRAFT_66815 [Pyrenochaeta sp. MPI-SDFR-AT-0127]|nr:hypothetical protein BKA66DRAFT_66815 [Pyrenochaeta sp. MPI-SDFR-AT-0127]